MLCFIIITNIDVRTQADYQQMDPNFVGLIFSCFSETEKVIIIINNNVFKNN